MLRSWTPCASASSSLNTARSCGTSRAESTARPTDRPQADDLGISHMRAQFVFSEVWIGLRRNLTMTIALIVVVAISLSLLGTGLLFVKQVDNTRSFWQSRVQISVYLCTNNDLGSNCAKNGAVTDAEIASIKNDLLATHDVAAG